MTNMTTIELNINGKTHLCQVTANERRLIAAGAAVNIPADRRVPKRQGIPRSMQLAAAGIAFQPIIY